MCTLCVLCAHHVCYVHTLCVMCTPCVSCAHRVCHLHTMCVMCTLCVVCTPCVLCAHHVCYVHTMSLSSSCSTCSTFNLCWCWWPSDWALCCLCQEIKTEELTHPTKNRRTDVSVGYNTSTEYLQAFTELDPMPNLHTVEEPLASWWRC